MTTSTRRVVLLGATGSVGRQAVDLIERHRDRFEVVGIASASDVEGLRDIAQRLGVQRVAVARDDVPLPDGWGGGVDSTCDIARLDADIVLVAISGAAALRPTLAALEKGTDCAISTKEVLVMAGDAVTSTAAAHGAHLYPVDSEHSAIWQCLRGEERRTVSRLVLTASGGPFRERELASLADVTPDEALRHPNWSMGDKITVDSATMMNKGLEVIEAHYLFGVEYADIDVVIHPQSIVHSMVEFSDGATMAQLGIPDMQLPIALALNAGERLGDVARHIRLADVGELTFAAVDDHRFPAVSLARAAGNRGGLAPAVLNAANEVAVAAFLEKQIRFTDIVPLVERAVEAAPEGAAELDAVVAADAWARKHVLGDIAAGVQLAR